MFGHTDDIEYRLPLSVVRVSGTVTRTTDTILEKDDVAPEATMVLDVIGETTARMAKIESGLWRDTSVAFELTEDGRLTSSAVESTGQAGKAVLAVAGVGGTIAGLALGLPPGVLIAAAGAVAARARTLDLDGEVTTTLAEQKPDEVKIEEAYRQAHPGVLALSKEYASLTLELNVKLAAATKELAAASDSSGRATALSKLRSYRQALAVAERELDRLKEHFKAWRAGTFETRTEDHEYVLPLDVIRAAAVTVAEDGTIAFAEGEAAAPAKNVWAKLGLAVRISPGGEAPEVPNVGDNEILFRVPRRVRLDVYEKDGDKAILLESREHLVMDGLSSVKKIKLRKSAWAKRSSTLKFSTTGALTGYASTATAAGAAFAETVQSVPETVASSLEQSKKVYDQVEGLRGRTLDQRLARLKKEVELKQQELTRDGLLATAGSYDELEALKQQAAILEQRDKIAGYDPPSEHAVEMAALKKQIELLTAKHDLAVAQRTLTSEADLGDIWREIERLSTRRAPDDARRADGGTST